MAGDTEIHLVGNLTSTPELRFTPSGAAVCSFTVASTPRFFDKKTNEWRDGEALFMRCNLWRQAAEHATESLNQGDRVLVIGRLKQRSFEKDGQKRSVMELEVDEVGPSVKWATVKVNRVGRGGEGSAPNSADDPWGSAPIGTGNARADSEVPF